MKEKGFLNKISFTIWEVLGYFLAFIDPIPLGIVVGIFMYGYETRRYVAGGKRVIVFCYCGLLWFLVGIGVS